MFKFYPEQASEIAPQIDWLSNLITDISVFFTVIIVGTMIYFAIRYRRRDGVVAETPRIEGSGLLEVIWTVVPTVVCIFIGYYGIAIYRETRIDRPNQIEINVYAQKWMWDFEYQNGKKSNNEFVVPVNTPIKLILKSRDVLHSFFLPAMRAKKDAIPSGYTSLFFVPVKVGEYQTFCTEYCGKDHSAMQAKLHVVSPAEYERWLNDKSEEIAMSRMPLAEVGQKLYMQKGCNACHSLDGTRLIGPSFLKIFGKKEKLTDGTEIQVDENYIEESLIEPNKKIVEGYPPNIMPSFAGQLAENELPALIAFIKSVTEVKSTAAPKVAEVSAANLSPAERGKKIYETKLCMTCHSLDGSKLVGPSFKGIYGRVEKLTGGESVTVDDAYLSESILNPAAKVVEGYPPAMPPYQGQLDENQIKDVIEFFKTLK